MPLPRVRAGESRENFMARCMGDAKMMDEYKEHDQRAAVCMSQFGRRANNIQHMNAVTMNNYAPQRKVFENRAYVVAPVVLLTVGVHAGSAGPVLYEDEELRKFTAVWNGVPVPVLHPMDEDGDPISCNSPEVLDAQNIGRLFNVIYESPRLRGEIWVDEEKAKRMAPKLLSDILAGKQIEVSTGLFYDVEETEGDWNGEHYNAIVRNIRPDHLALLPGQVGACSLRDGCGVRANKSEGGDDVTKEDIIRILGSVFAANVGQSFEDVRKALQKTVDGWDQRPSGDNAPYALHYVVATYEENFIYLKETRDGSKLYKRDYAISQEGTVNIGEEVVEVREESRYVPVSNAAKIPEKEEVPMKKCCPEKVKALIDNQATPYTAEDKEWLESMSEAQLAKLEMTANAEKEPAVAKEPEKPAEPAANAATMTFDQFLATAPAEYREVVSNGVLLHKRRKAELIATITANAKNVFKKEDLEKKSLAELEGIAALAAVPAEPTVDYGFVPGPLSNAAGEDDDEVLEAPSMSFSKQ